MNRSDSIAKLTEALCKAQATMKHAKKDSENPHFRSKYADLSAVVDAIRLPLSENGLAYIQTCDVPENKQGVIVETILSHVSGEWVASSLFLPVPKFDPQGIGSAITYGKRYSLSAITGLATDEDDDGNGAGTDSGKGKETTKTEPAKTELSEDQKTYFPRIKVALDQLYGADVEQKKTLIKRLTAFKNKEGKDVPGVDDYRKKDGTSLKILCTNIEKMAKDAIDNAADFCDACQVDPCVCEKEPF